MQLLVSAQGDIKLAKFLRRFMTATALNENNIFALISRLLHVMLGLDHLRKEHTEQISRVRE